MKFSFRKNQREALSSETKKNGPVDFGTISRNESNDENCVDSRQDDWQMPYQISGSIASKTTVKETNRTKAQILPKTQVTQNDKRGQRPMMIRAPIPRSKSSSSKMENPKIESKQSSATESLLACVSSEDLFEDLPMKDSLDDIMDEPRDDAPKSETEVYPPVSASLSSKSSSSSASDRTPDLPIDIDPAYAKKKGILIVDPNNHGRVYHMSEKNKNLMNKDLIIINGNRSEDSESDSRTQMSNLTEVTYEKTNEEKIALVVQQFEKVTGSSTWCNLLNCSTLDKVWEETPTEQVPCRSINDTKLRSGTSAKKKTTDTTLKYLKSFVSVATRGVDGADLGSFQESISVCITRVYLTCNSDSNDIDLKCTFNQPKLAHDLGVRLSEMPDGRAVVTEVLQDSSAMRSGVLRGDILSFAVPLNNTFQGYEKACDFISRLELIGMRASYREIFDMFLSKTSAGWPVALVFRRISEGVEKFESFPLGMLPVDINIDLSRASDFFHEVVTRGRDFDYYVESKNLNEEVRGNIEYFMPKPFSRCLRKGAISDTDERMDLNRITKAYGIKSDSVFVPKPQNYNKNSHTALSKTRCSSLITWYTENSNVILYLKVTAIFGGSGVLVCRTPDGSWSAPLSIGGKIIGASISIQSAPIECVVFIRDALDIQGLRIGEDVTIGGESCRSRVKTIVKLKDTLLFGRNIEFSIHSRDDINNTFYSEVNGYSKEDIVLSGKVPIPNEAVGFYGALRRLEFPSTMYPHPTPPSNLLKFNSSSWKRENSCKAAEQLEAPCDDQKISTLRDLLSAFAGDKRLYSEEIREFGIFMNKFKQMLFDGVTIERFWIENDDDEKKQTHTIKVALKLRRIEAPEGNVKEELIVVARSGDGDMNQPFIDFERPLLDKATRHCSINEILPISSITHISQRSVRGKSESSSHEDKKRRKRFVSLETEDEKKITFLARTGKDATLLACGIKLMVERSHENGSQ